jgi:beta-galactosidase
MRCPDWADARRIDSPARAQTHVSPIRNMKLNHWTAPYLPLAAILFLSGSPTGPVSAQPLAQAGRERLLIDSGWRFAFGHPSDARKDFNHATGYFSYLAKTGYGDGPAAAEFEDRAWRTLDLPHDWAAEMPFDGRGSHSHGYKAVGRNFPDSSVGWYRKSFFIPASDLGRRISIEFDGIFRDSRVWINGHYLGNEPSGYASFGYNLSEFLNYGGNNVIAVRVDATLEEGWFYEGAGIYRHVWLVKTDPLHVERNGTFVTSEINQDSAQITARVALANDGNSTTTFDIEQTIMDADGQAVAEGRVRQAALKPWDTGEYVCEMKVARPKLWSIETPHIYRLETILRAGKTVVDRYYTSFGIRTVRFDPDQGFFLNGKRVELKGSNNHQDHAGVGSAIPDALQDFRIVRLKAMGGNAYRCSHHPPTPELLDACDRLGMVVIDENRLMGTSEDQLGYLKRLILRDRNHPSVILWSLGNEEWGIEGNIKGARITATMQAYANRLDPTRPCTVAISGGWGGSSTVIQVAGYNYIHQSNPDKQHADFPRQSGVGTEETTTQGTRGVYFDDRPNAHMAPVQKGDSGGNCELGWKYYAARPFLAGLFYWTGFDYRGESTPFGYPAVSSQFGILDTCGFPKDSFHYLKAWWTDEPVIHVFPHWNWPGKEGQELDVWCYSNAEEVELLLNGQSLGRKTMEKNGHLEWKVAYTPGTLLARGYRNGKEIATHRLETTGAPAAIQLAPDRAQIKADTEDLSVITVQVNDAQGHLVPTAGQEITFALQGPGRIIGVGNGDPSSHEPDRYVDQVGSVPIRNWRRQEIAGVDNRPEVAVDFDDSGWPAAFGERSDESRRDRDPAQGGRTNIYRGVFQLPQTTNAVNVALLLHSLGEEQSIFLNGNPLAQNVRRTDAGFTFHLEPHTLRPTNVIAIIATSLRREPGNRGGRNPDGPGLIRLTTPAGDWKRRVFNGLAQVIVQSTGQPGDITLTAKAPALDPAVLKLQAQPAQRRPAVPTR